MSAHSNPSENTECLWLDVGNTRTHWWLDDGAEAGALDNERLLGDPYCGLPQNTGPITEVVCASVGAEEVVQRLKQRLRYSHWLTVEGFPHRHLTTVYEPEQLGRDRWLAMLGTLTEKPASPSVNGGATIIVDAGTALTVDMLEGSHHLGGWIMPGLVKWHQVLYGSTQIRRPMLTPQSVALGENTSQAMAQAWLAAAHGLITQALQTRPGADIVLTGGDAGQLKTLWPQARHCPNLIWCGMKHWRATLEKA